MPNNTPLSGLSDAAGGILLTPAQGGILTKGVLEKSGALSMAGDARTTASRKEQFQIWNGEPTAEFVGEGGTKPVTGAEFGAGTLNIKKVASIVTFTDEMLEDVANGDMNVLVDSGVRSAIARVLDANAVGKEKGTNISSNFDEYYLHTTSVVEYEDAKQDALSLAVSAAMGSLEANGYDPAGFGLLLPGNVNRILRDARVTGVSGGGTVAGLSALSQGLYQTVDPFYGVDRFYSTNLNNLGASGGTNDVVAVLAYRPNVHLRIRHDVRVKPSNEATVGGTSLYQNDLTALRYVTRQGFWIHDINRAVVKIINKA